MRKIFGNKLLLSGIGLAVVFVLGAGFLLVSIMRINPLRDTYTVTVNMNRSGGLQANNDVTYRGFRVGKVKSLEITPQGVAAKAEINSSAQIPQGGQVAVRALSAAGEQFLDFQPASDTGPYLQDGSVIAYDPKTVITPVPVFEVLDNATTLVKRIDPKEFTVVLNELDKAVGGGSVDLKTLVQGASITIAGLDTYLPQTTSLIANLGTIMSTTSQAQPDLQTLTSNGGVLFGQLNAANAELTKVLDTAGGSLSTLGDTVGHITDPATRLVQTFAAIARAGQLRTPALAALFPALRDGIAALGTVVHENVVNVLADIYVRPTGCDYKGNYNDPTKVADPRVRLYNYCDVASPGTQVRGAANAPRPNAPDNTSGPPPGATPNDLTSPAPRP